MSDEFISTAFSFVALVLVSISYFFKKKSTYLFIQASAVFCLVMCYVFFGNFIGVITLGIGLIRTGVYFAYERKNRRAPIWVVSVLCGCIILNYILVVWLDPGSATPYDWLLIGSMLLYGVIFGVCPINLLRYTITVPLLMSTFYNLLIKAPIFSALSYFIEFIIAVVSIIYFIILNKRERKNITVRNAEPADQGE